MRAVTDVGMQIAVGQFHGLYLKVGRGQIVGAVVADGSVLQAP